MQNKEYLFATFRYLYKKVKNFLSKAQSKELLTFLFFLCLSFLFWILQSMNEESEAVYRIPVRYRNVPEDIVFTQSPPEQLTFRLRDKGIILLNYSFNKRFLPIEIDVRPYLMSNKGDIRITEQQLHAILKKQLNPTSSLLSIAPDTLSIYYCKQGEKMVPVHFQGMLTAGSQFQIGSDIRINPDSVKVFAASTILDTLKSVSTQYIQLIDLSDTIVRKVNLIPIHQAKIVPVAVQVTVPVEEYTEKVMMIPLSVNNVPDSLMLRTFPSMIQLSCFVVLRDFKDVTPESFEVAVDYNDLRSEDTRLPVEIIAAPDNVTNVRCKPDSVEFIIEVKEK
ncbi:MAG: CdaR family protein [Bacteroidales bacterium]